MLYPLSYEGLPGIFSPQGDESAAETAFRPSPPHHVVHQLGLNDQRYCVPKSALPVGGSTIST
jgi:hypothetical protein